MFICIKEFFSKANRMRNNVPYENEIPGPSHRIDDELKAPGSLWSKSLYLVSIVLIQAVWQQERQFFQLLEV
jgi:hypothetical protein